MSQNLRSYKRQKTLKCRIFVLHNMGVYRVDLTSSKRNEKGRTKEKSCIRYSISVS